MIARASLPAPLGFSTVAGYMMVAEDVVWAKLRALADGAAIASRKLRRGLGRPAVKRRSAPKKVRVATHKARKSAGKVAARKAAPRRKTKR